MVDLFKREVSIGDLVINRDVRQFSSHSYGVVVDDDHIFYNGGKGARLLHCHYCYLVETPCEKEAEIKKELSEKYQEYLVNKIKKKETGKTKASIYAKERNETLKKLESDERYRVGVVLGADNDWAKYVYLGYVKMSLDNKVPKSLLSKLSPNLNKCVTSIEGYCYTRVKSLDKLKDLPKEELLKSLFSEYFSQSIRYSLVRFDKLDYYGGALFLKSPSKRFNKILGNVEPNDADWSKGAKISESLSLKHKVRFYCYGTDVDVDVQIEMSGIS